MVEKPWFIKPKNYIFVAYVWIFDTVDFSFFLRMIIIIHLSARMFV